MEDLGRFIIMKTIISACFAVLIAPSILSAQIIINDSWADGDRARTGALDADWWSSNSTSGNSIEVAAGALGMVTGTSGRGIHGTFSPQTLGVGETLTATVTFTTPATVGTGKGGAFKFAMMDFNNVGLAANLSSSSSSANPLYTNLPGYMLDFDVNTGSEDINIREHQVNDGGRFLGTTGEWDSLGSSSDDGYSITANTEYFSVMAFERTGLDTLEITGSLSQGGTLLDSHVEIDSSGIANNFGMVGFWGNSNTFGSTTGSDPDNGLTFSNFTIERSVIPEPSSAGLLLLGGLLVFRRRKA